MVRRIRWQILIALCTTLLVFALLGSIVLSSAASTHALQGSVYVEGVVGAPRQLNPLVQGVEALPVERDLAALLFEGLTRIDATGRVEPALAERWSVTPDERVYTFALRGDRTWHDGTPVTPDDVLYTVRGVQNANFPGDPALASIWRNVLVRQLDQRTIQFELSAPFAPFPSIARLPILPAHLFRTLRPEQWATAPWSRLPVGTGKYRLHALDAEKVVLVPFEGYPGVPALDNLVLRFYPTLDAALLGLGRREVQGVAASGLGGRQLPVPPRETQRLTAPLGDYTILTFNLRQAPLDDLQLRTVLALGINRQQLVAQVLDGHGQLLESPVLPGTWASEPAARLPAFRRSAAQQLLGSLGYIDSNGDGWVEGDGQRLLLPLLCADTVEAMAVARNLAQQLREIGIALEIRAVPSAELQSALAANNFTLAIHTWSDVGADPDVFALWHSSRADGGTNYAGLDDDRIDQLLAEGRATTDATARKRIYGDFQRRWVELIPSLPLYQNVLVYDVAASVPPPAPPALVPSRAERFTILERWFAAQP